MKDRNLKIVFGISSIILLVTLLIKLNRVPGGFILSGLFLGGIYIFVILCICFVATFILKFVFKNLSYSTIYFVSITVCLVAYHYYLYSPTLKIIVQDGYTGEVNLVLSNVNENILTLDSSGIGYINKSTYDKTYSVPDVYTVSGQKINSQCVGFNPSTFFGLSKFCCIYDREVKSLSFEIVPVDKKGQKQYYSKDLKGRVDTLKLYRKE